MTTSGPARSRLAASAAVASLALLTLLLLATALRAEEAAPSAASGSVRGQVFDRETGEPVEGVTVVLEWPAPEGGGQPRQEVQVSDGDGGFGFPSVPAGTYDLGFHKAGYEASTLSGFEVVAGQVNRADFPLPPRATATADEILELEAFVVEESVVDETDLALDLRLQSDELVNTFSAADFSKFSAGDVAEALDRVAGVTVAEGQFAVIRGLEDRYNSTLYNDAPIPSPDPDKQSVQLDLFPSDVVSNLVVSKTFVPDLPSNSSGGAINILTHDYPSVFEFKISAGTGWNENAKDRFVEFEGHTDLDKILEGVGPVDPTDPDFLANGLRLVGGSPVGKEDTKEGDFFDAIHDVLESDYNISLGGRKELEGREFRFKGVLAREVDYVTAEGYQENREPLGPVFGASSLIFVPGVGFVVVPGMLEQSGDLSLGVLSLSDGRFDLTTSQREEQNTAYAAFGFDLDEAGNHKIDASYFTTEKNERTVQLKENGTLDGLDYGLLSSKQLVGDLDNAVGNPDFVDVATQGSWIARSLRQGTFEAASRGALAFTTFMESKSFQRDRKLRVWQVNGDHRFEELPGLNVRWAWNTAKTSQDDVSLGMRFFFEPCGFSAATPCDPGVQPIAIPTSFPPDPALLGPGRWAANNRLTLSANRIDEHQDFFRLDADYETDLSEQMTFTLSGGMWWERARREVESAFLESPIAANPDRCIGAGTSQFACFGDTPLDLGKSIYNDLTVDVTDGTLGGLRRTTNDSLRKIDAWHLGAKTTLWERLDLLGGIRREKIVIESNNDPFVIDPTTGEPFLRLGGPQTFPTRFLFFDRVDTIAEGLPVGIDPSTIVFNDQILGVSVPVDPTTGLVNITDRATLDTLVNGKIDETKTLPSAGVAIRPVEGLSLRGAWSRTVARPSFREMGFYVSVEPGSDDLIVGNPQLGLSDVESWDTRVEYVWGPYGDLAAASFFYKTIDDPIESIIVRDPTNFDTTGAALYRTFFNNPNQATLKGFEVEARKSLGFFGPDFLNYLSIGGNYTYIDASVDRTEAELARSRPFFGTSPMDVPKFVDLETSRRLFNQPEWIVNADLTFSHPDWGTTATLALFGISDVLDAAGTATLAPNGDVRAYTLDRYVDSYYQLDLIVSQMVRLPRNFGALTFKGTLKNLTDSTREIVYDRAQTHTEIEERSYKIGRDYSLSITWTLAF